MVPLSLAAPRLTTTTTTAPTTSRTTTTMETIAMTTDKKSILSEYNRKEANAAKCGNKVAHRKSVRGKNWLENSQLAPDCGCAPNPNCEKDPLLELVRGAASTCSGAEQQHANTHTCKRTHNRRERKRERVTQRKSAKLCSTALSGCQVVGGGE